MNKLKNVVEVDPCWAVFYRYFMMPGGIVSYGSAEIVDFYPDFETADREAKRIFKENKTQSDIHVWVMKCIKTYQENGVAVERKETKETV